MALTRRAMLAALAMTLTGCSAGRGPVTSAPAADAVSDGVYWAIILSPGPRWDYSRGRDEQAGMREHRAYMASLFANGTMLLGGPFVDELGGFAAFRAVDEDVARRAVAADPGVRSGLFKADLRRWRLNVAAPAGTR